MKDPEPANIRGVKASKHQFSHSIRWDYMVIGVGFLYVAWKVLGGLGSSSEVEDERDLDGVEIAVGGESTKASGFAHGGD